MFHICTCVFICIHVFWFSYWSLVYEWVQPKVFGIKHLPWCLCAFELFRYLIFSPVNNKLFFGNFLIIYPKMLCMSVCLYECMLMSVLAIMFKLCSQLLKFRQFFLGGQYNLRSLFVSCSRLFVWFHSIVLGSCAICSAKDFLGRKNFVNWKMKC